MQSHTGSTRKEKPDAAPEVKYGLPPRARVRIGRKTGFFVVGHGCPLAPIVQQ